MKNYTVYARHANGEVVELDGGESPSAAHALAAHMSAVINRGTDTPSTETATKYLAYCEEIGGTADVWAQADDDKNDRCTADDMAEGNF